MPYIPQYRRQLLSNESYAETSGELNFEITRLIKSYWQDRQCYSTINDIIGALEAAKLEFYRRVVIPYEEDKKLKNGDVYGGFWGDSSN